jgi:hypothetical protein
MFIGVHHKFVKIESAFLSLFSVGASFVNKWTDVKIQAASVLRSNFVELFHKSPAGLDGEFGNSFLRMTILGGGELRPSGTAVIGSRCRQCSHSEFRHRCGG